MRKKIWLGFVWILSLMSIFTAHSSMMPRYSIEDLPKPLSALDIHRYKTAIKLQQNRHWGAASYVLASAENNLLRPWMDFYAYSHLSDSQGSYNDLNWFIKAYPEHPKIEDIYKKAQRLRRPSDSKLNPLNSKKINLKLPPSKEAPKRMQVERTAQQRQKAAEVKRRAEAYLRDSNYIAAEKLILSGESLSSLSFYEADELFVEISRFLFNEGKDDEVMSLAAQVAERNGDYFGEAWWLAGLSAWRKQDYERARSYFAEITKRPWLHENLVYGAYFWQARSNFMLLDYDNWQQNLIKASKNSNNFYGLLAGETLGRLYSYNKSARIVRLKELFETTEGQRFLALMQLGQINWAKDELLAFVEKSSAQDRMILLWMASEIGWLDLVYKESEKLKNYDMNIILSLPRMPKDWVPPSGMVLDEALTLAVIQKESRFNENARSHAGALGLMQVTPQTKIQTKKVYDITKTYNLKIARDNVFIGQRYMNYLLSQGSFNDNLFFTLAAWNAGPTKSRRWLNETWRLAKDPIFWVESIPVRETRLYVKEVSANLWRYRYRLGQQAATLEAITQGYEPIYNNMDP
ncbi:MAG: transglycosylase SLT domain-containing protein [Alphaproteobacteria bacterium]